MQQSVGELCNLKGASTLEQWWGGPGIAWCSSGRSPDPRLMGMSLGSVCCGLGLGTSSSDQACARHREQGDKIGLALLQLPSVERGDRH